MDVVMSGLVRIADVKSHKIVVNDEQKNNAVF